MNFLSGDMRAKIKYYDHTKTQHHRRKENIANKKFLLMLEMPNEEDFL